MTRRVGSGFPARQARDAFARRSWAKQPEPWIASGSTNGCGTRGWSRPAPAPQRLSKAVASASTACARDRPDTRSRPATSSPSGSTAACVCWRSRDFPSGGAMLPRRGCCTRICSRGRSNYLLSIGAGSWSGFTCGTGPTALAKRPIPAPKMTRLGDMDDLRRHWSLHQMQIYRLRWGLPGGLFLRGREHAGHSSRRMHRLRRVRTGVPCGCHQAGYRARVGEMARGKYRIRQELAQYYPKEGLTCGRERIWRCRRQIWEVFFSKARRRWLRQQGLPLTLI